MEFTYLWFMQDVFEWVFDKILDPIFEWLSSLLSSLFEWIYTNLLYPYLEKVFLSFFSWAAKQIFNMVCGFVYYIYAQILSLIDALYSIFDILSGLADVTYGTKQMPLPEALFQMDSVNRLFWMVNFMGLCLALLLTIYAVGKSAMDLDFENRRPVSRVLSALFKCFIQLFSVQIMVMGIVYLSQLMLKAINTAVMSMHGSTASSIGCILFGVTSMSASKESAAYNLPASTANLLSGQRGAVYRGEISYTDIWTIRKYFDLAKFDYVIGILLGLFLLVVFFACLLVFCQRIFDMLTLYIVSPLFVATIPLDDGEKFRKWRELFLGKTFSGFGLLFAMKFYIMLCPLIMDSRLSFTTSPEFDYLTKLVFLAGGALAVMKSGHMVTGIISTAAGGSEAQMTAQGSMIGMMPLQMGAGALLRSTMGGKRAGAGNEGNAGSAGSSKNSGGAGGSSRYVPGSADNQYGGSNMFGRLKDAVKNFTDVMSSNWMRRGGSLSSAPGKTGKEASDSGVEIEMQVFHTDDTKADRPARGRSASMAESGNAFDGGIKNQPERKRSASVPSMPKAKKSEPAGQDRRLSVGTGSGAGSSGGGDGSNQKADKNSDFDFGSSTSINDVDDSFEEETENRYSGDFGSSTSINDVDDGSEEESDNRYSGDFGSSTSINDVDDGSEEETENRYSRDFGFSTSINDVDDDADEESDNRYSGDFGSSTSINDVDDDSDEESDNRYSEDFGLSTSINDVDDGSDEESENRYSGDFGSSTSINDVDDDSDEESDNRYSGDFGSSTSINDVDDGSDEESENRYSGDFGSSTSINDVDDGSDEESENRYSGDFGSGTSINDSDDSFDKKSENGWKGNLRSGTRKYGLNDISGVKKDQRFNESDK